MRISDLSSDVCSSDLRYKLGYERMDDTHLDFVEKVNALLVADDSTLLARLDDFIIHADAHFGEEKEWMETTGFPAAGCHNDEHDADEIRARSPRPIGGFAPSAFAGRDRKDGVWGTGGSFGVYHG